MIQRGTIELQTGVRAGQAGQSITITITITIRKEHVNAHKNASDHGF